MDVINEKFLILLLDLIILINCIEIVFLSIKKSKVIRVSRDFFYNQIAGVCILVSFRLAISDTSFIFVITLLFFSGVFHFLRLVVALNKKDISLNKNKIL